MAAAPPRRGVTADLSEVAADIGATVDDARRRDQRLLDAGGIAEWVARMDPAAVGAGLTALLLPRVAHNAENYTLVRQSPGSTRVEEKLPVYPVQHTTAPTPAAHRSSAIGGFSLMVRHPGSSVCRQALADAVLGRR